MEEKINIVAFGTKSGEMLYGNPSVVGKDTTSYIVKSLSAGTTYYFRVRAGNNCMPGEFSNELSVTVYGETISEIPEGFSPGVLSEKDKSSEDVLGDETTPTSERSVESEEKGSIFGDSIRKYYMPAGIILILLASGYYFIRRRRRQI